MERALSQDERIRRAEEIYARRQNARERTSRATVNISSSQPKNFKLFKRLALQALVCLLIYFIFHLINTTNYSFSEITLDKTEELISQDVDFMSIYNNIAGALNGYISNLTFGSEGNNIEEGILTEEENQVDTNNVETQITDNKENIIEQNTSEGTEENTIEDAQNNEKTNENIAFINNEEDVVQDEIKEVELSETDRIKQKYSFIVPVKRMDFFWIWRKRTFF